MKFPLPILFVFTVFLFECSISASIDANEAPRQTVEAESTTTTITWWRTFPIYTTRTDPPRPPLPARTTTRPNRVSDAVSIAVPLALFGVTIVVGFGLIAYASFTGGNGVPFLTRTNA